MHKNKKKIIFIFFSYPLLKNPPNVLCILDGSILYLTKAYVQLR